MRAHNPAVDGVDHDMCGGLREEVDPMATDLAYSHEVDNAHQTIAQWYKNEMDIYSFGSLAGYAAACDAWHILAPSSSLDGRSELEKDRRFAADLLVKIDVHDELDGYDDFVCKALDPQDLPSASFFVLSPLGMTSST
eukprot:g25454.t1